MAREQRNDVDYFPHYCVHGRKMHIIETKYGNDGYALWFKLLEHLGNANYHYIDISDEMNFMYLVSVFKVEQSLAKAILNDLAKLGAIDQNLYENHQILYSEKFVNSIEDAYKKRKSNVLSPLEILKRVNSKKNQSAAETGISVTETYQSAAETPQKGINPPESIPKEKKRKEKDRKEEKNARAYDLLKSDRKHDMEIFEMQNKKQIQKWDDLVESFNDTIDIEISQGKIEFVCDQLFPRFKKFARSWLNNQNSYSKPNQNSNQQSTAPKRF